MDDRPVVEEIPTFARMREYVDPDGVRWRRRGDRLLAGKDLGRRLRHDELQVLHHYMGELTQLPPDGREAFWSTAQASMRASTFSDFVGVEFRNEDGHRLLVVEESC